MMSLDDLIAQYGYAGVFAGAFLQSETVVVMGGISVHRGYLEFALVILCAFCGTLSSHLLIFYLGQVKGKRLLEHRPRWKARSSRILGVFEKHHWVLMLGYRFVPGMGKFTPLLIGTSGFKASRFLLQSIPAAALWAVVIVGVGALFSKALDALGVDFHRYELWIYSVLGLVAIILLIRSLLRPLIPDPAHASEADQEG